MAASDRLGPAVFFPAGALFAVGFFPAVALLSAVALFAGLMSGCLPLSPASSGSSSAK